jgi:hypothetical protein
VYFVQRKLSLCVFRARFGCEAADTPALHLAGMLGNGALLVDVRDADLGRNAETLVQFIELAIFCLWQRAWRSI